MSDRGLQQRVVVENVKPAVDDGRFPIKRVTGETVEVTADVFADGHDVVAAVLMCRKAGADGWVESRCRRSETTPGRLRSRLRSSGRYEYTVEGWVDRFATWRHELSKKMRAGQEVPSELLEGAALLRDASAAIEALARAAALIGDAQADEGERKMAALSEEVRAAMAARPDRRLATRYDRILRVTVERERARFGAWYKMFPRSAGPDSTRSATFAEAASMLPYVRALGFDVLYLPPIHPIGRSFRKGRNNALTAEPGDPGSPWAIGSAEGGHTAVDPGLGTMDDFERFVAAARGHGLEIALDLALPGLARSPVGRRAPGVVPAPARRHDQIRREPTEEVSGHLSDRLRVADVESALERAGRGSSGSGSGTACASSASTTRTPSRSVSGSG